MNRTFIVVFLSFFSCVTLACSETEKSFLERITQSIQSSNSASRAIALDLTVLEPVCKQWPSQKGKSILVKPYSYSAVNGKSQETYLAATIAVIDTNTGGIVSIINDEKISTIDAIFTDSISIDTARYKLSNTEIAFGVRFSQRNQSNASPFQEEFINLYIPSSGKLMAIARGLRASTYNGEGNGNCLFDGTESNSTISIKDTSTNQKRDITITTKITGISSKMVNNKCITSKAKIKTSYTTIKFNGTQYEIPKENLSTFAL